MSQKNNRPTAEKAPRRPLPEWLAVRLDVPADLLSGGFRADLRGRNSLTVHGVRRILAYSPERIVLALREGSLSVCGERLTCASYLAGAVGIDGHIRVISLEETEQGSTGEVRP